MTSVGEYLMEPDAPRSRSAWKYLPSDVPFTTTNKWSALPDELLLKVARSLFFGEKDNVLQSFDSAMNMPLIFNAPKSTSAKKQRGRLYDILRLSMVNIQTRSVVLEPLFSEISVQIANIPSFLRMLSKYTGLAKKIKTLHLKCSGCNLPCLGRLCSKLFNHVELDESLVTTYKLVSRTNPNTNVLDKHEWDDDIMKGDVDAIMAVLFAQLPDLRQLSVQDAHLNHLSFLNSLCRPGSGFHHLQPTHGHCNRSYLYKVVGPLLGRLNVLDMPRHWSACVNSVFIVQAPIGTATHFQSLRCLVTSEASLFDAWGTFGPPPIPSAIFPPSLESLKIHDVDFDGASSRQNHRMLTFLDAMLITMLEVRSQGSVPQQQQTPSGDFPRLRYVYIKYNVSLIDEADQVEEPQETLEQMGKALGVDIEFSFPW